MTADPLFADNAQPDLDSIRELIDLGEAAGTLRPIEASIHRLYIAACRDPTTRMGDRLKAVDALAKLQGLFVDRVRTELDVPQDMPTAKLLMRLSDRLGLKGLQLSDFNHLPAQIEDVDAVSIPVEVFPFPGKIKDAATD